MSYRDPCRHCGRDVIVARVRGGRWLPFEVETVSAELGDLDTWVPTRSRGFVPVAEVAARHLVNYRRYAKQHRCAEFMRWLSEKRDRVSGFNEALGALVDLWTKETPDA